MTKPKKLIEVAMPVKEISAESVRDKLVKTGLPAVHQWWARRPLPACIAVIFASLVPDPLDENCPKQFKEAIEAVLGSKNDLPGDPYKPYDDIPHTIVVDKMEDNLRNRLLMFIGKFSDKYVANEKVGKITSSREQLHKFSLVKWDNKNDDEIIGRARKLIFVSHNAEGGKSSKELLTQYDKLNNAIKKAEFDLYNHPNRHLESEVVRKLEKAKDDSIAAFLAKMPKVFDPFAGGGAIPLEAARLGCNSYGNDINPVAHIIQKGSCELPQKFGKPITFTKKEFIKIYGNKELQKQQLEGNVFGQNVSIPNRLALDVEFFALKLLGSVETEMDQYYPKDEKGNKPIAYYWARVGECANPSCNAQVPLLKQFYLSKKKGKSIFLNPIINGTSISFEIKNGSTNIEGWIKRGNLTCPCCGNTTDVKTLKKQFLESKTNERMLAVIWNEKGGKEYKLPTDLDLNVIKNIPTNNIRPQETMPVTYTQALPSCTWGLEKWGEMFTDRQIIFMNLLVLQLDQIKLDFGDSLSEYHKSIVLYLAMYVDKLATFNTSYGRWDSKTELLKTPFARQAIPMIFDFPETTNFHKSTGGAITQIRYIVNYIKAEGNNNFPSIIINSSSGDIKQFSENYFDITVTDPPYFDAIAYADLSDFFYVWLKRTVGNIYPINFATPKTPKSEECTALKHHHQNSSLKARLHFENKLGEINSAVEYQTKDLISIMFAHQSTSAWTTLCNSILQSSMNITGSWAIDSESSARAVSLSGDSLASSVTVACKPSIKKGIGDYKEVQKEILQVIKKEVKLLYDLGFRGADLLTACFGQAVSVFGKYESVEKADGSEVTVAELLEMAREGAFDAIVSDIDTDDLTKFYIGWLNLFGFSEAVHDDVRRISQIGLSIDISDIYSQNILVKNGDKGTLGSMKDRINEDSKLGLRPVNNTGVDIAHRLMYLFDPNNGTRADLLDYISENAPNSQSVVWRVLNSLAELLPKSKDMKDHELVVGLLSNQENLLRDAKNREETSGIQSSLDFE